MPGPVTRFPGLGLTEIIFAFPRDCDLDSRISAYTIKLRLISSDPAMGAYYYDEIEIEDMIWDDEKQVFHYPCPCGDRFEISRSQLANYEDVATCPSCSLVIRVIYDPVRLPLIRVVYSYG